MSEPARIADEPSLSTIVSDVASDVKRLLRQEVELAKTEVRAEAAKAGRAGRMLASGAMALHLAAVVASVGGVFGAAVLLERFPVLAGYAYAAAAAGVALIWLIVGAVLVSGGRRRLRKVSPIPHRTIQTLKEDIAWLRKPTG